MSVFTFLHGADKGPGFWKVKRHVLEACGTFLYGDCGYVFHCLYMTWCNAVMPIKSRCSYGTHLLNHLTAHGACLPGSQVAVVTIGQVDTHFRWCTYYIVNSSDNSGSVGLMLLGSNSRMGSLTISPMNL